MYNLMKLTILTACLAMTMAIDMKGELPLLGHRKLMDFMVQSRDVSQKNPERSVSCFGHYIPILNSITAEYESNYAACLIEADEFRSKADESTNPERYQIENSAESACYALKSCTNHQNSMKYFECFEYAGSENSKAMYTISINASDALANVREKYRIIENDKYRCTNNSERSYVENTASTYEEMQNCLTGLSPVPTTTSSPVTKPTESSTTIATEITTEKMPTIPTRPPGNDEDEPANPNSRLVAADSKWGYILGKPGRHVY